MNVTSQTQETTEYRAHLTLPTAICTITGENQGEVENLVKTLLGPKVSFVPKGQNSIYVYHTQFFEGTQPIGWISKLWVPETMSVRKLTESRLTQAA